MENHIGNGINKTGNMINGLTEYNVKLPNGLTNKLRNGPEQEIYSESYWCTKPDGHVKLRIGAKGVAAEPPVSVPGLLTRAVVKYPDAIAMMHKVDGEWKAITYKQYHQLVRTAAKAFLKLGLQRYHSVCILGFNSPQWFISDLAAIHAGGFACGIYTTNSAEACLHCLETSRANICVVQDKKQLDKVLAIRDRLPNLKAIVQWEAPVDTSIQGLYTWDQLLEIGEKESDLNLDSVLKTIAYNECCTLVFTSGTVGKPKAVMLSHDNLTWDAFSIWNRVDDLRPTEEHIVSYLPLSHVAAQSVDLYMVLTNCSTVYFAQPDALKGSIIETLKEVRPTRFLAVPRLWEKMYEKMMTVAASNGGLKAAIAAWAKSKALDHHSSRISNGYRGESYGYRVARSLIFSRIHAALGLDRCTTFVSAAAPISADIKKYFLSIDIPIVEAFGMSEASGAHTLGFYPRLGLDSVGETLDGVETKFLDAPTPMGPGEICLRGRHVLMGYLNDEDKTISSLDSDGWLMTGDVGRLDENNYLYITGRIKELLITAGGENVAPVPIEQSICKQLPHVAHAVVIGDRRKFLSVLLTLRCTVDNESGEPLDELEGVVQKWLKSLGCKYTLSSEVASSKHPSVLKAIEEGIVRANKDAISNAQKVQKFAILPKDFSMFSGELGPTMKLKRNVIYEKYSEIIEGLYKD